MGLCAYFVWIVLLSYGPSAAVGGGEGTCLLQTYTEARKCYERISNGTETTGIWIPHYICQTTNGRDAFECLVRLFNYCLALKSAYSAAIDPLLADTGFTVDTILQNSSEAFCTAVNSTFKCNKMITNQCYVGSEGVNLTDMCIEPAKSIYQCVIDKTAGCPGVRKDLIEQYKGGSSTGTPLSHSLEHAFDQGSMDAHCSASTQCLNKHIQCSRAMGDKSVTEDIPCSRRRSAYQCYTDLAKTCPVYKPYVSKMIQVEGNKTHANGRIVEEAWEEALRSGRVDGFCEVFVCLTVGLREIYTCIGKLGTDIVGVKAKTRVNPLSSIPDLIYYMCSKGKEHQLCIDSQLSKCKSTLAYDVIRKPLNSPQTEGGTHFMKDSCTSESYLAFELKKVCVRSEMTSTGFSDCVNIVFKRFEDRKKNIAIPCRMAKAINACIDSFVGGKCSQAAVPVIKNGMKHLLLLQYPVNCDVRSSAPLSFANSFWTQIVAMVLLTMIHV